MFSNMEDEDDSSCTNEMNPDITNWSKAEKLALLQAFKIIGFKDIDSVSKYVPTKTPEQINLFITAYRKRALQHPVMVEKRRRIRGKIESIPRIPLASWAKFLTDSYPFEELQTEISAALRMIRDLEDIPPPSCTEHFDIRLIYSIIANAAEGKFLPDNNVASVFVDKCMVDTALLSKSFIQSTSLRYILEHIDTTDKHMNLFTKLTLNNEFEAIQHIALQNNFNPLHVPEEYLKPSKGY